MSSNLSRDKIRGLLVGTAIGDALGIPTETFTSAQIREKYPEGLTKYEIPDGHKWYEGQPAGTWSDDTALTIATMKGLISAGEFDLASQAQAAVDAMTEAEKAIPENKKVGGSGIPGWGSSTVEAVRRLANNVHWLESGKTTVPNRGTGNGAVMRCGPLAAYFVAWGKHKKSIPFNQMVCDFSAMTHYTDVSAIATVLHVRTLVSLLEANPDHFDWQRNVIFTLYDCENWAGMMNRHSTETYWSYEHLNQPSDDMWPLMHSAIKVAYDEQWSDEKIEQQFGGGSCYVGHSVPFTYAHMARRPLSIQTLYRVAAAGGDTDTNASLVGGALGALYGLSVFPEHLINGLIGVEHLLKLANDFCDKFKVK